MVKFLLPRAFAYSKKLFLLIAVLAGASLSGNLSAQCTFNQYPEGGTITPTADVGYGSVSVGSGTYVTSNVHNGGLYTFSTCSSSPAWGSNTQLTGFNLGSTALFYNDDNGPVCAGTLASQQWSATSTTAITVHTNANACNGWQGSGAANSALLQYRCDGPGNPAIFGTNTWNLYAFNDGDAAGNSGSWSTAYSGYLLIGALSFNTQTLWPSTGSPSDNPLFLGCHVLYDNHSWTAKRRGFTCGVYQIDIPDHDDRVDLLINGSLVFQHVPCCDAHTNVWTGTLTPASTIEFRVSEGGGGSSASITITNVTTTLDGGTVASNQTICSGGDPAAFTSSAAASGGAGSYTYNWYYEDNCVAPAIFAGSGLTYDAPSGLTNTRCYYRIATDACAVDDPSNSATVSVTADPSVSASGATTICAGGSTTLTATPSGGTGCSTVTWESSVNGISGWTATGLSGNSVSVSPASSLYYRASYSCGGNGCNPNPAVSSAVLVTVNPQATANAGLAQTVCQGGTITLAGSVGGGASSGTWSAPSGTFSNINSLSSTYTPTIASGPITLTLTTDDPTGPCPAVSSTVVVTVNTAPTANAGFPQTVCEGGTINLTGGFGGSATSATWSAPSGSFSNVNSMTSTYTPSITSGNVTLTLTSNDPDGAGPCTGAVSTVVITVNQAATASAGPVQTVCGGGTITLAGIIGGSATSSTWSAGTGTFSNVNSLSSTYTPSISSGTVTLTLTTNDPDGGGPCVAAVSNVTITVNQAATANAGTPQTVCEGGTINLSGGIGGSATSATWSAPSGGFSNVNSLGSTYTPSITSGTVTLTLTTNDPDGAGPCSPAVSTVVITVNQAATANAGSTQTVCQGGTVTLAGSIGGSATSSTWSAPTGTFSNVNSLGSTYSPSIVSGNVTLTLTTNDPDGVGPCQAATSTVVITVTPLPDINSAAPTAVLCFGGNTGTITVSANNGTPPLQYSIDNGATYQASNFFNNLVAGSYTVIVKDAQTCSRAFAGNPVVVTQPPLLDHTTTVTDASCANVFDGKIDVFATGGVPPYSYSINGGPTQVGSQFTGLQSGPYVVYVFDVNGCVDTSHVIINDSYNVSSFIVSQTNVSCYNGNDGAVTVQIVGGTPAFSHSINGTIFSGSPTFTGLTAANYVVILRDSKGCTAFQPVNITQPAQLSAIIDVVNDVTCNGTPTGEIFMTVSGGTSPYSYYWSNGDTIQDVDSLLAGTYTVTITDAKGCTTFSGATVAQPVALYVNVASYHDLKCFNDSSGSIDITVSGGIPPYSYVWSNGAATEDLTGLHGGTYTVTVYDNNLCQKVVTQAISEPTLLTSTITGSNVTCNGVSNGTVDLTVSGGTSPYTYLWSNATTNEDLTNVSAGTYSVVVTDAHGCVITNSIAVSQPAGLGLTTSITNVLCFGDATGAIDLTVTGGTPSYGYLWSNSSTNEDQSGLTAGPYTVSVTDLNGCSASVSVTITQPAQPLSGTLVPTAVTCNGANNGSVNLTVTGGTQPYTFSWSNTATTEDISGLNGNTYSVTVTDANGCIFTGSAVVTEPVALSASISGTNVTCFGGNDGAADLTVSGGNPSYTYGAFTHG